MPSLRTGRSVVCLALACAGLAVVWTPSVFAGGWAITTLDSLPNELRAGETYAIGYVIRQHGQTPFTGAHTAIEIRSTDGQAPQRFSAIPDGAAGHYVAQVTFPTAGEWQWDVDQTPFAPQALGTITVRAPSPASDRPNTTLAVTDPSLSQVAPAWPALGLGLTLATALALAVLVWRPIAYTRFVRSVRASWLHHRPIRS